MAFGSWVCKVTCEVGVAPISNLRSGQPPTRRTLSLRESKIRTCLPSEWVLSGHERFVRLGGMRSFGRRVQSRLLCDNNPPNSSRCHHTL